MGFWDSIGSLGDAIGGAYDNSWLESGLKYVAPETFDYTPGGGSWFSGISGGLTPSAPQGISATRLPATPGGKPVAGFSLPTVPPEKSWLDKLGDTATSSSGLTALLTTGLGALDQIGGEANRREDLERAREKDKYEMLIELAKLKYGPQGGSGVNRNKDQIEALQNQATGQSNALVNLMRSYQGAYGG